MERAALAMSQSYPTPTQGGQARYINHSCDPNCYTKVGKGGLIPAPACAKCRCCAGIAPEHLWSLQDGCPWLHGARHQHPRLQSWQRHSRTPSIWHDMVQVQMGPDGRKHITIVAKTHIPRGSELCYDYLVSQAGLGARVEWTTSLVDAVACNGPGCAPMKVGDTLRAW